MRSINRYGEEAFEARQGASGNPADPWYVTGSMVIVGPVTITADFEGVPGDVSTFPSTPGDPVPGKAVYVAGEDVTSGNLTPFALTPDGSLYSVILGLDNFLNNAVPSVSILSGFGSPGNFLDVNLGMVDGYDVDTGTGAASTGTQRVVLASNQTSVPVTQSTSPWVVSGAVTISGTVAVTQSTSPWVTSVSNFPATQSVTQGTSPWVVSGAVTVSGAVAVSNFPASYPVTQVTSPWVTSVSNFPATQSVTQGTSPWVVSGAVTVSGTVTATLAGTAADDSANSTTKLPVLPGRANAVAPSWTEGRQEPMSFDLAGNLRIGIEDMADGARLDNIQNYSINTAKLALDVNAFVRTVNQTGGTWGPLRNDELTGILATRPWDGTHYMPMMDDPARPGYQAIVGAAGFEAVVLPIGSLQVTPMNSSGNEIGVEEVGQNEWFNPLAKNGAWQIGVPTFHNDFGQLVQKDLSGKRMFSTNIIGDGTSTTLVVQNASGMRAGKTLLLLGGKPEIVVCTSTSSNSILVASVNGSNHLVAVWDYDVIGPKNGPVSPMGVNLAAGVVYNPILDAYTLNSLGQAVPTQSLPVTLPQDHMSQILTLLQKLSDNSEKTANLLAEKLR